MFQIPNKPFKKIETSFSLKDFSETMESILTPSQRRFVMYTGEAGMELLTRALKIKVLTDHLQDNPSSKNDRLLRMLKSADYDTQNLALAIAEL
jgi:hypothetical protein